MAEHRHQPGETASTHATCGSGNDNPIGEALLRRNADPPPTTMTNNAFK